jgi:hypothetical protein
MNRSYTIVTLCHLHGGSRTTLLSYLYHFVQYQASKQIFKTLSIIREVKLRKMKPAGYVACMGRIEMHTKFWLESLK